MAGEIAAQKISEGAVNGRDAASAGTGRATIRENIFKQTTNGGRNFIFEPAGAQLPEDPEKTEELVRSTVDFFNQFVKEVQVDLKYEVDEKTNEVIIKFFEKGSGKLIKQIPPEAILHLKQRINDLLGIIYDEKV